ncbi:MAG: hypothetical protein QXF55_00005 [Candidatus Aenigmatarchaeota archaeon]
MNPKLLAFFLLLVAIAADAHAIGIAPSRIILNFTPGDVRTLEYFVRNNQHKDLHASVYVRGELAQYLDCPTGRIFMPPSMEYQRFSCRLELPESLPGPKRYDTRVGVVEVPSAEGSIGAVAGVEAQLWIDVLDSSGGTPQPAASATPAATPTPEEEQSSAPEAAEVAQPISLSSVGIALLVVGVALAIAAALLLVMLKMRIIRSR